jgi:hypothetical protein
MNRVFYENVKFLNTFILVFSLHVLWTELLMFKVLYEMNGGFLMTSCGFVARTLCWRIIELSFHSSLYCFQHCEEGRAYEHSNIICLLGLSLIGLLSGGQALLEDPPRLYW